jgi:hypothetical protein
MKAKTRKSAEITQVKRGRPRLSNLSDKEQARLRMEKIRKQRRKGNLVAVEVCIPKSQHNFLRKHHYNLSEAATEAFALLVKARKRKSAGLTEDRSEDEDFRKRRLSIIDLDNPPD